MNFLLKVVIYCFQIQYPNFKLNDGEYKVYAVKAIKLQFDEVYDSYRGCST